MEATETKSVCSTDSIDQNNTMDDSINTGFKGFLSHWNCTGCRLSAYLLLGGSLWPLLKNSLLLDSSVWIWPWSFFSQAEQAAAAPAIATYSNGEHMMAWVLVPVVCGILAFGTSCLKHAGLQSILTLMLGSTFLLIMLSYLFKESEIYGLASIPPTADGGAITFGFLFAFASLAMANHLRKFIPENLTLRIISGIAGLLIALSMILFLIGSEGVWTNWSSRLLQVGFIVYGGMGLWGAFSRWHSEEFLSKISFLGRGILCWSIITCMISQLTTTDPFSTYVIGAGGGFFNVLMSVIKSSAIYIGGTLLLAYGLGSSVGLFLFKRIGIN